MKRCDPSGAGFKPGFTLWLLALAVAVGAGPLETVEAELDPPNPELKDLEAAMRAAPDRLPQTHAYRLTARQAGHLPEAIQVLEELVDSNPDAIAPRLDLALALIDRLADPELDLARRAVIASQATRHLNHILTVDPTHWAARYVRGMTHLLWPRASQHAKLAIEDFERLVATQPKENPEAYFARAHVGLGDAHAMNVELKQARDAWRKGKDLFPNDSELAQRLALGVKEIKPFVLDTFRLDRPFSTDLSFLRVR